MRRCGFSDKMFYYNGSGEETNSMRMRFELSIPLTREMLDAAVRKTFSLFPDYTVRPVIHDGKIYYEENTLPIPIFWNEESAQSHYYGSDEVNGYLFVVSGDEHSVTFSQYHGLTDFVGYWSIVHTLLQRLMAEAGVVADDPLARTDTSPYDSLERDEREDPYSMYENQNAEDTWGYRSRGALVIPEKVTSKVRFFDLFVSEEAFLAKTREYGTSFVPLLSMITSWAINELYGIRDKPVVIKVPANLRPLFDSKTTVNFSDSAVMEYPKEFLALSREEQGKALRTMLKAQLNPGTFQRVIAKKIQTIRDYEDGGQTIQEINQSIKGGSYTSSRPVTLGLTYPGKLIFPEEVNAKIVDIIPCAYMPTDGVYLTCMAFRGNLRIRVQQKYETTDFVEAFKAELEKLGMQVRSSEVFLDLRDFCDVDKLKIVSK